MAFAIVTNLSGDSDDDQLMGFAAYFEGLCDRPQNGGVTGCGQRCLEHHMPQCAPAIGDGPLTPHGTTVVRDASEAGHRRSFPGGHPPEFRHVHDQHGRRDGANPS